MHAEHEKSAGHPPSSNEQACIPIGSRVLTPLGAGMLTGIEQWVGNKRYLVKLDDPSRWAFGASSDVAAFFVPEVSELSARPV